MEDHISEDYAKTKGYGRLIILHEVNIANYDNQSYLTKTI